MKFRNILIAGAFLLGVSPAMYARSEGVDTLSMAVATTFANDISISLQRLRSLGVAVDTDIFIAELQKVLKGEKTDMSVDQANAWLDSYIAATRPEALPDVLSEESQQAFLDQVASIEGAVRYPDGLILIVEREGEGPMPGDDDVVRIMYSGKFFNGDEFDATVSPIEFKVTEVTPGFSEGLKLMRPGGRYRIVMPASLAYGQQGIPGVIPGNAALDFTVDLIGIN